MKKHPREVAVDKSTFTQWALSQLDNPISNKEFQTLSKTYSKEYVLEHGCVEEVIIYRLIKHISN